MYRPLWSLLHIDIVKHKRWYDRIISSTWHQVKGFFLFVDQVTYFTIIKKKSYDGDNFLLFFTYFGVKMFYKTFHDWLTGWEFTLFIVFGWYQTHINRWRWSQKGGLVMIVVVKHHIISFAELVRRSDKQNFLLYIKHSICLSRSGRLQKIGVVYNLKGIILRKTFWISARYATDKSWEISVVLLLTLFLFFFSKTIFFFDGEIPNSFSLEFLFRSVFCSSIHIFRLFYWLTFNVVVRLFHFGLSISIRGNSTIFVCLTVFGLLLCLKSHWFCIEHYMNLLFNKNLQFNLRFDEHKIFSILCHRQHSWVLFWTFYCHSNFFLFYFFFLLFPMCIFSFHSFIHPSIVFKFLLCHYMNLDFLFFFF